MSALEQGRGDFERIVARWAEALAACAKTGSDRDRDSAILRFELAYEVAWKLLQRMARQQGLEAAGPRETFSQAFRLGWIEDETAWFDIITARNLAVHVYREASAAALAAELPRHLVAFQRLLAKLPAP
ncbi:MAG: nucleotidyltransferase substrate binding protein [Opitutae bacterium]|nr:nucleotidyltransferase substrate binding protein [Opitutae bacterium]